MHWFHHCATWMNLPDASPRATPRCGPVEYSKAWDLSSAGVWGWACHCRLPSRWKLLMGVFKNRGTPKSSFLVGFSLINHPFLGTPIFGNTLMNPEKSPSGRGTQLCRLQWCQRPEVGFPFRKGWHKSLWAFLILMHVFQTKKNEYIPFSPKKRNEYIIYPF